MIASLHTAVANAIAHEVTRRYSLVKPEEDPEIRQSELRRIRFPIFGKPTKATVDLLSRKIAADVIRDLGRNDFPRKLARIPDNVGAVAKATVDDEKAELFLQFAVTQEGKNLVITYKILP